MIRYINKSMVNRIVVMISIIFTLTALVIGTVTFRMTYNQMVENKLLETSLRSELIAKDITKIFDSARLVNQQLSLHPEVVAYLKTAVNRRSTIENPYYKQVLSTLIKTKESNPLFFLAWVANEKANFYLDSSNVIPDETYDVKKRPWYAVGANAKEYAFTTPYVEWETKQVVISCVRPMRERGVIYGFVVVDFILDNIPVAFKNANINPTDKSFLITAEGQYVFHPETEKIMNANINDATDELNPYAKWITSPTKTLNTVQYQGKNYYLHIYKVNENNWKVVTLIDKDAIQSEIQKVATLLLFTLTGIFGVTLILVRLSVRSTLKPYKKVMLFAQDIAAGEFSKNIPEDYQHREDEMGTLSRSFQIIIDAFRNENEVLEHKIAEKNVELENQYAFIYEAEKAATLGNLVAGVAHEINTPVGNSLSTASYLKKVNDENRKKLANGEMNREDLKELMTIIDESTRLLSTNLERAADLVKNFKQLAVDQSSGNRGTFDLKSNIDSVVLSLYHEYKHLPITIDNQCPAEIILDSYPGAFSQVFTNLIMNSLHHGFIDCEEGKIIIQVIEQRDQMKIIYTDDGRGISRENLKKMYEPFFTTNRQRGNSGLGMHIVMNIVTQKLKGSIRCESELGQGVKFTIEFPAK